MVKKKDFCFKLSNSIFRNTIYYGRKRAAKALVGMEIPAVSDYVMNNILHDWKKLTETIGKRLVTKSPPVDLSKEIKKFSWLEVFNRMKQYW